MSRLMAVITSSLLFFSAVRCLGRRLKAWKFLLKGPVLIQEGFDKAKGCSFEILGPDSRYVFVSSTEHIKELLSAPDTSMSLYAASRQILQPKFTMRGFNWLDKEGAKGNVGGGFVRAVRVCLTNHLPIMLPSLGIVVRTQIADALGNAPVLHGVKHIPISHLVTKLVVRCNAEAIFGKDLAMNEIFLEAAQRYPEESIVGAEILRLVPIFGSVVPRWITAQRTLYDIPLPVAESRLEKQSHPPLGGHIERYWIIESVPEGRTLTPRRLVHELMAIWFGSIHALAHVRVLLSLRRCATGPFSLSDGTRLNIGDWACAPFLAIDKLPEFYPDPYRFSGFRFAPPELEKPSKFTDSENSWLIPAFHRKSVTAAAKVIISQMLANYDLRLANPSASRCWTLRSAIIPREDVTVVLTPRAVVQVG
ncbi:cytochrome P450 [Podospora australis]|uniref:Cytochrome P450 n=1 Tax=Podospora australis TaxID=1536484 RepID=A0AAN6WRS9_9PEZI|nr:cytochrome P450 [Podospora australis]